MSKTDIVNEIKNHLFLDLSTINTEGYPETRRMVNLLNSNIAPHLVEYFNKNQNIYIMTNTSSRKMKHIKNNNKGSVYYADDENYTGLILMGDIKEITDSSIKNAVWHDSWSVYYQGGSNSEDFCLLEFIPNKYKVYSGLSVDEQDIKW